MNTNDKENEVQPEVIEPLSRYSVTVTVAAHNSDEALQLAKSQISDGEVEWVELVLLENATEVAQGQAEE